jgi:hypothetical protein
MIDGEKGYKKVMDEKYKIYCKKISDDLKNASRDSPKQSHLEIHFVVSLTVVHWVLSYLNH